MKYNKDRMALLAGIDGRDEYFGKTLRENFSFGGMSEAEDDLDAVEDADDDTPVDVEGGEEGGEEAPAEDMVSKEDVAGALADVLGVDAGELTALVSDTGEEAEEEDAEEGDEEAEEEGDDEGDDLDLDLGEADEKGDVDEAYEADEKEEVDEADGKKDPSGSKGKDAVSEIRKIVRRELASMIKEGKQKNIESRIRAARRHKSVAVAMGYKK